MDAAATNIRPLPAAWFSTAILFVAGAISFDNFSARLFQGAESPGASAPASLALLAFTLVHGGHRLGARRLGVLMAITFVVTFSMEAISIATGLIGDYVYTPALGPKLLEVPLLIPAAWLMMLYPTLLMVETILGARPISEIRARAGRSHALCWAAVVSIITGFAMTAWDIGVETIIVVTREYTWTEPGSYFGVPIPNFVSWVGTSAAAAFAFLAWEMRVAPRAEPGATAPEWQPIAAYFIAFAVTAFGNLAVGNRAAVLITVFTMSPFILIATARILHRQLDGVSHR